MKPVLDWYFDFISPFSYLQSERLDRFSAHAELRPRPILFAGLLTHWGNVGPAELVPKRAWTFEHCAWLAHRHQIALTAPAHHPFNPLPLLRACLVGADDGVARPEVVTRLFRFVWAQGHLPTDASAWSALVSELGINVTAPDAPEVKQALRANGERAIAAHVFGVPTSVIDGHTFWGFDATDMVEAFLRGDPFFEGAAYRSAAALPEGLQRQRRAP